jgi:hypothetical protein
MDCRTQSGNITLLYSKSPSNKYHPVDAPWWLIPALHFLQRPSPDLAR